jgi:hypothetical protein
VNGLIEQQRTLLAQKLAVLARLQANLRWSFDRLPQSADLDARDPAITERTAAIVERFTKLQDQLAGALQHAHAMLGEKHRSFSDVVDWSVAQGFLPDSETWLELRALRNRLTHEYELENEQLADLLALIRAATTTLATCIQRFERRCRTLKLIS